MSAKLVTLPEPIATRLSILLGQVHAADIVHDEHRQEAEALGCLLVEAIEAEPAPSEGPPMSYRLVCDDQDLGFSPVYQMPSAGECIVGEDGCHMSVRAVRWRGATVADVITVTCPGWSPAADEAMR